MKKIIIVTAALLASSASLANTAGTHVVHGGLLYINPANDASELMGTTGGQQFPLNRSATVDAASTLGFGYDYYVTDNIAVGIQLGIPPKFDVQGVESGRKIGEVEQRSPEIKAKYVFGNSSQKLRPYLGGGIAYVMFDGEITDNEFKGLLGSKVDVESKIAPVVTAGASYQIDEKFSVSASVSYMKLETDITYPEFNKNLIPGTKVSSEAKINPVIMYLSAGYSF